MIQTIEVEGKQRLIVPFNDNDGVVILANAAAIRERYATTEFDYDIQTLKVLNGLGELVPLGTHGGSWESMAIIAVDAPFSTDELDENDMIEALDVGVLILTSELVVTDWACYTFGCDTAGGQIDSPHVAVAHGNYRVTIHRSYGADDDPDGLYMIELNTTADAPTVPDDIAGNDGYFS